MPQPQLDPQMYQDVVEAGEQQMQMQQPQNIVEQNQQMQMQQPSGDDIEEVKKLLGVDDLAQKLSELEQKNIEQKEQLKAINMEKTKAVLSAKYKDIPFEIVEKEIEKVKQVDPQLAEAMLVNPELMEIAYKSAKAEIKPDNEPDKIIEGEGGGAGEKDELTDKISSGKASEDELGDYILQTL